MGFALGYLLGSGAGWLIILALVVLVIVVYNVFGVDLS